MDKKIRTATYALYLTGFIARLVSYAYAFLIIMMLSGFIRSSDISSGLWWVVALYAAILIIDTAFLVNTVKGRKQPIGNGMHIAVLILSILEAIVSLFFIAYAGTILSLTIPILLIIGAALQLSYKEPAPQPPFTGGYPDYHAPYIPYGQSPYQPDHRQSGYTPYGQPQYPPYQQYIQPPYQPYQYPPQQMYPPTTHDPAQGRYPYPPQGNGGNPFR